MSEAGRDARPGTLAPGSWEAQAVQLMVLVGGVGGLSWEVLWQIEASLALGVSAFGTAVTLAVTMAGMSAGSLAMGSWLRGRERVEPLRLYGGLEAVVALCGLVLLACFDALETLDVRAYGASPTLAPLVHLGGIALVLGVPAAAMGATIPVFRVLARTHGTPLSLLYGTNTAGAFVGTLLVNFVLLRALGVAHTRLVIVALEVVLVVVAFALPRRVGRGAEPAGAEPGAAPRVTLPPRAAAWVAFTTGLVTFGLEVAWFRSMRAAFMSTTDSFAIMLASVLLPLAIGARLVPVLRARPAFSVAGILGCAAAAILLATPLVERMDLFALEGAGYWKTTGLRLAASLAILGVPMTLLGIALPWCLEERGDPRGVGELYGLNTVGAVVGALGAAWLLLPAIGFARASWLLGALVAATAIALAGTRGRVGIAVATGIALLVAVSGTSSLGRDRIQGSASTDILAYHEGPDVTTSVVQTPNGVRHLYIDGFLATTSFVSSHYMRWMGTLPMLLHDDPERALVICFGTGQTADAVRAEGPERLDIAEINPAVLGMADLFPANRGVLEDERVHPIVMDGRAWLRRQPEHYDVVTLEPMPPHFAGVNALYSREFYEIIARKLDAGGIAVQWLPIHITRPLESASVVLSFIEVFPDALLWIDPVTLTGILIGRAAGMPEPIGTRWPGLERGGEVERTLDDEQIRRAVALDGERLRFFASLGDVITDDNQLLAYGMLREHAQTTDQLSILENLAVIQEIRGSLVYELDGASKRRIEAEVTAQASGR